jgi:beta-xylosidase
MPNTISRRHSEDKGAFAATLAALLLLSLPVSAQNPIVPPGLYIADPSAHVWKDGKMYVYGSRDESPKYYCSWDHYVLSSSDLVKWEITKNAFASKGPNDQVAYSDDYLYAPDCQYKDGTYYLYYCLASKVNTEGVATSRSPTGPFTNGRIIDLKGYNQIDPQRSRDDHPGCRRPSERAASDRRGESVPVVRKRPHPGLRRGQGRTGRN